MALNRRTALMRTIIGTAWLVGITLLAPACGSAETVLKLAHASSTDSLINKAIIRFADEVKASTKGAVTVQIFPDGQLGDEGPIADGVGSGSIDFGLGGVVDAIDARLNVVTLPFLFKDAKAVHAVLDGPIGQELFKLGGDRGFIVVGALNSGFRQFATASRADRNASRPQGP